MSNSALWSSMNKTQMPWNKSIAKRLLNIYILELQLGQTSSLFIAEINDVFIIKISKEAGLIFTFVVLSNVYKEHAINSM